MLATSCRQRGKQQRREARQCRREQAGSTAANAAHDSSYALQLRVKTLPHGRPDQVRLAEGVLQVRHLSILSLHVKHQLSLLPVEHTHRLLQRLHLLAEHVQLVLVLSICLRPQGIFYQSCLRLLD